MRRLIRPAALPGLIILALFLSGVAFWLAGCNSLAPQPLPTYMPQAAAPALTAGSQQIVLPATYTAVPVGETTQPWATADIQIAGASAPLQPTQTPLSSRTPAPLALIGSFPQPVNAPFWEQPPATTPCIQTGTVFRGHFPSQVSGPWRAYHAYLPPCYGQDQRVYPVLYLIHGSIQTDSHWLELGLAAYADAGIAAGRYPPFIAIMPFSGELGNISSGGERSIEGITLNYLLPYVQANFCAWDDRAGRSIGGISRGGYWALEMAFLHPDLFGAVSGHSSHLRFETDGPRYNPLATYATVDLSRSRIWLDRGEKDFLRPGQNQLHDLLSGAGILHEYRVNPGGHNEAYWAAHLPEYLDWHAAGWPMARSHYPLCTRP